MRPLYINHNITIEAAGVFLNQQLLLDLSKVAPEAALTHIYRHFELSYPKFFKMDNVSRLGFLAAEILLQHIKAQSPLERTAVYLTTYHACLDVDEKFQLTSETLASPALFVYTLPNIVAGEICIRNGFKGEQMVLIAPEIDKNIQTKYLQSLFSKGHTDAALTGFINAYHHHFSASFDWVTEQPVGTLLSN